MGLRLLICFDVYSFICLAGKKCFFFGKCFPYFLVFDTMNLKCNQPKIRPIELETFFIFSFLFFKSESMFYTMKRT
jgi:hypothetical protein